MPDFKFQDSYKEKKNKKTKYHWVNYDYIGLSSY